MTSANLGLNSLLPPHHCPHPTPEADSIKNMVPGNTGCDPAELWGWGKSTRSLGLRLNNTVRPGLKEKGEGKGGGKEEGKKGGLTKTQE